MAHADLDALIDGADLAQPHDELGLRRLKKRRLALRDEMQHLYAQLTPGDPA